MGHSFHCIEGPRRGGGRVGSIVGGQKRIPAQPGPGTSVALEENENSEPPLDIVCPHCPRPALAGQVKVGASVLRLVPC